MKQSLDMYSILVEVSCEIFWTTKGWCINFMRTGTYEPIRVLSKFSHLYDIIRLYKVIIKYRWDFELNRNSLRHSVSFHLWDMLKNWMTNWMISHYIEQFPELGSLAHPINNTKHNGRRFIKCLYLSPSHDWNYQEEDSNLPTPDHCLSLS